MRVSIPQEGSHVKRTLLDTAGPSWLVVLLLLLVVAAGVGAWLYWLRRNNHCTRDHLYTAAAIVGMAGIILIILHAIGRVRVNSYGAMLMCGFIAGAISMVKLGRRRGIPAELVLDLGLIILVGAILGARITYVLITKDAGPLFDLHRIVTEGLGGLSFHGGLIGGFITGGTYIYLTRLNFLRVLDSAAPAIAIGYAITRIGCLLNGCCYGKPAPRWLPWAMNFPDSPDPLVVQVHPTQLYASLMGFAMFGILLWLSRGQSLRRAGRLFMVFMMLEGVERFVMEIFRYQPIDPTQPPAVITLAQLVSILIFLIGIVGFFLLPNNAAVDVTSTSHDREPSTAPAR